MAQLAIKGHETRGNEVIELLEMLGGKTTIKICGNAISALYSIFNDGHIDYFDESHYNKIKTVIFTLEEFLEKYPYKVGDGVLVYAEKGFTFFTIQDIRWNNELNKIEYKIGSSWCDVRLIIPYKEKTMEEKIESFEILESHCADEVKIEFDPSKFEIVERENGYYVVKKQPKYPKTYEECCEIMDIDVSRTIEHNDCPFYKDVTSYEHVLLSSLVHLRKLLICRDAYWKIAGEERRLGKAWEPDWNNLSTNHEFIKINKGCFTDSSKVLVFPTEEMRDAFYENFKDLIEECKELL